MASSNDAYRKAQQAARSSRGAGAAYAQAQRSARNPAGAMRGYGITTAGLADLRRKYPADTPLGEPIGTVAGSILDYVSRPAFMVADLVQGDVTSLGKNALNLLAPGTQAIEPLAGSRETVSQALEQRGVNFGGGIPGFMARFATDVVTDPLTYLSLGTASGLKGAAAIGRAASEGIARSGAKSPRVIAEYERAGLLTPEQAQVERIRYSSREGPELQKATKEYLDSRGGQGIVAGLRVPVTVARTASRITGKNVKTVYPFAESKTLAKGLGKLGMNMSGVRGVPVLRSVFTAAGGEDEGAYQSFLGAMNVVNQHKAGFARDSRNIEKIIEKTGAAGGIKRVDASPTVSHLYDAPAVAQRGIELRSQLTRQMERTTDDAERLALQQQIDSLPTDTRSAYEWLRANHNHGTRFQFPEYNDAVRVFGNPDDIAEDSILGIVRQQARKYEDYADTAGVLYDKLDQPYLTHLGADQRSKDALEKFDEATQVARGTRRKMQEGFTRHRYLPTLMDWYLAEATQGIKLVPELSVGNRLTARGVSGASEAMHAVLMREFVKMYGARGPLPDMNALEDDLAQAIREFEQKDQRLAKMLGRSNSPMAKQARSDYARLRRELSSARKALADAKKNATRNGENVASTEVVKAAQKAVDDIKAQIEEVKNRPRVEGAIPADLSAKRAEQIAEATRNLEIAQADRVRSAIDMGNRITRAAVEKVRDVKSRFDNNPDDGPGVFDTPEAEAQAVKNEEINFARQEVDRLTALVHSVVHEVARWMSKPTRAANAAERKKARGGGDLRATLGKKKKARDRESKKPNPNDERIAQLDDEIAQLEKTIAEFGSGEDVRVYSRHKTKQQREGSQGHQGEGAARGRGTGTGRDSRTIPQRYDDAMQYILDSDTMPDNLIPPAKSSKRGTAPVTQEEWDATREQLVELVAAQKVLDDLESNLGPSKEFLDQQAREQASLDALGGGVATDDGVGFLVNDAIANNAPAQDVFRPVNIPEGEAIPVAAQPSDIMERAATDQLPWSQRQVVKLLRKRFGSPANMDRPWVSVKPGTRGSRISVGGKNAAISQDELLQMEQAGWIVVDIPNAKGEITRIKPGPQLQAEGLPLGEVEATIRKNLETVMRDAGAEPVRVAKSAVERASAPVGPEAKRVAELEASLKTAIEQGRTDKLAEREIGRLKAKQVEASARLADARKRGQQELIAKEQQRVDDLASAQAALKEFIRALKTPPNARKVASATRKRDKAGKAAQRMENAVARIRFADEAAKEYVRSLYKAEASYEEAVLATGYVKSAEDWLVVQESWLSFVDRYIPRSSKLDPNAGTLFDPAIAPQIKRVLDRINPEIRSQSGLRKIGRFIRGLTRAWKSLVLATPGYHIRNMIDDGLRAYWAGARDPTSFYQAVRILQGKADNIKIRGQVYSREEILSMANAHGIIGTGSQYHSEVGPAYERQIGRRRIAGIPLPRKPGSGAIVTTSQMIGEMRENMTRLGTFIELLKNGEDEIIAGKNVRDFLFDYNDVSPFIIAAKDFWSPFITYTMKAVPFYAKTLVQRPGQLANLGMFMRDMTATAAYDYPGQVTMEYMAPGQELSFALPRIPGVSDALFGEGKPGAVDPSNLIGISAINQVSPITFPQPGEGETALGAALGTVPRGLARVSAGLINPLARYGIETATQQDMRFGSPLPNRTRLTPVPLAAQQVLSAASGGTLNLPGYGMKTDAYSGEQVEGASTNLMRLLNLFPPVAQVGSYATLTGGLGFDNPFVNENDAGRISFVRTFSGIPVRPLDVSRAQYFATRRQ